MITNIPEDGLWLITGSAGFIGSNFVRLALQETRARLLLLDALTYAGNLQNLTDVLKSERCDFIKGDINDTSLISELLAKGVTHLIHFAAESHVDRSILGPEAFLHTNVRGTFNLLECVRKFRDEHKHELRFLHVSTDEVYGSIKPTEMPASEDHKYFPNSPYSASKAASDHFARAWFKTYQLPIVITNCSNNYGPWQFPEKLIPLMIVNAMQGRGLPVYGDGLQIRDWIHVEDHCKGLLLALQKGRVGETYNIGGSDERPNREIVEMICAAVDQELQRPQGMTSKQIQFVADRPGHDRRYAIDSSKIQRELGWAPKHKLETALPQLVAWYKDHSEWLAAIRSGAYMQFYKHQYGEI